MNKYNEIEVIGRTYAIGDIHGCCTQITALLKHLEEVEKLTQEDLVVFTGDFIDRGPNSIGVLNRLIQFKKDFPKSIFLRGNHEDMFLDFIGLGGAEGEWYLANGGRQVFEEYGVSEHVSYNSMSGGRINRGMTEAEFRKLLPQEHIAFIQFTKNYAVVNEKLLFVHAGIRPGILLEDQDPYDLVWIRHPFLGREHDLGLTVIHGHTISKLPYFNLPYEINLDTGCFLSTTNGWTEDGALTCLKITNYNDLNSSTFLQIKSGTDIVIENFDGDYKK